MDNKIHSTAIVEGDKIGANTRIWAFVHILSGAAIGDDCNICDHCYIENDVTIGNNVTIKSGVYLWDGVRIEDDVHIGPNAVFTNDVRHRSKQPFTLARINIKKGASIGANSTILGGVSIGEFAMSGIGSVITKDVLPYALVYGNPAKQQGWVDEGGHKLVKKEENKWESPSGALFFETNDGLIKL